MKSPYSTKLVSRSTGFVVPFGIFLILLGIASIILSAIDLNNNRSIISYSSTNLIPKSKTSRIITPVFVPSSHSEQSIWPTLGKGIWCGLFFIAVGIIAIIAHREKTLISIRILSLLSFIAIFIGLFLFLSSIIVFQRYIVEGRLSANQRTQHEQTEVILNALLFVCGVLSLLVSLVLAIGSLVVGNFCQRQADDEEHMENFQQQQPPPPPVYSAPPYYG
jgi:hypothetical protein